MREGQCCKVIRRFSWSSCSHACLGAASASQPAATQPIAVPFSTFDGYFVSNKFEPDHAESFVVIKDKEAFDEIFGVARVMRDKSHRLPTDVFDTTIVIAAIKRGKASYQFHVDEVKEGPTLTVQYTSTAEKSDSATFASPLIVGIPRENYSLLRFEENGKLVKTIEMRWSEIKQEAADEADIADAHLNRVYAQLKSVLDNDEKKRLIAAERSWVAFRDAECEFEADYTGSGTDRAVNYPGTAARLTEARTAELKEVLADRCRPKSENNLSRRYSGSCIALDWR